MLVKMCWGTGTYTQEEICVGIINPRTGKPISVEALVKYFAKEMAISKLELRAQLDSTLIQQAKKGSLGHLIWFEKTRLGIRDPSYEKVAASKVDAAGGDIKHEVEIVGGLPTGSRPDKPEGDDYSEIPPEESHG